MKKVRLDQLVFDLGYTESRERAKTTIMSGLVLVNGQRSDKPGMSVAPDVEIEVRGNALPFVSRGGFILDIALKVFPIDPAGKHCIDCGASTGGFTDVLLQHGAAKVYAVDVGYGQLAWKLRCDERVVNLERTNFRYVTHEQVPDECDFASVDVSFISLKLILPVMHTLLKDGGRSVCLIKPQFEAGKENIGKKGVVRDKKVHEDVVAMITDFAAANGFRVIGVDFSPIKGPEGNIEYLMYIEKCENGEMLWEGSVSELVERSHDNLDK